MTLTAEWHFLVDDLLLNNYSENIDKYDFSYTLKAQAQKQQSVTFL